MPSRTESLIALLAVQTKPKVVLPPTEGSRISPAGGTDCVRFGGRVRDRVAITAVTQEIAKPTERQKLIDIYLHAHEQRQAEERQQKEEQERRQKEKEQAAHAQRLKKENDARMLREAQERQSAIVFLNMTRAEIRSILKDASAEEILEVSRRVKQHGQETLPFAWEAYLNEVRQERLGGNDEA
jgi:hypothetical protein